MLSKHIYEAYAERIPQERTFQDPQDNQSQDNQDLNALRLY